MPFRIFSPVMGHAVTVLLFLHGAIHLIGYAKASGLAEIPRLQTIGRAEGLLWLAAGWLLLAGAGLRIAWPAWWWVAAAPGVLLSQVAIATAFRDAKLGTILNLILLFPLVYSMVQALPSSLVSRYQREARSQVFETRATRIVSGAAPWMDFHAEQES
jgi:hypothetical protein